MLSQWVSAQRLLTLFRAINFPLSQKSNYILYLIGMFYNFFIPGGIGGDAYKVYILNKEFGWSVKKLSAAIFVDRFMGLTAIGILITLFCMFIPYFKQEEFIWIFLVLITIGTASSFLLLKYVFPSFLTKFTKTLIQSIIVQLLQCTCVFLLLKSISVVDQAIIYVVVFLVSSVASIISFSGIGVREMIFYQAATIFVFDPATAVTIGLLFSIVTIFVSLFGIVFHLQNTTEYVKKIPENQLQEYNS